MSERSSEDGASEPEDRGFAVADAFTAPRLDQLLRTVQSLSTTSTSRPLLSGRRIKSLLSQSGILSPLERGGAEQASYVESRSPYENEIEWLLVSKATIHVYGSILNTLLDQIIPLNDDIWYWDEVLSSSTYSSLYTVQTSPLRFWAWSQDIYQASTIRMRSLTLPGSPSELVESTSVGLTTQWKQFYGLSLIHI